MRQTLKKIKHIRLLPALVALAVLAAGCTCAPYPNLDRDYGRAATSNLATQTVNPQAALNPAPAAGLSPNPAVNLKGKYDKSFKAEEAKPMLQLTTGGI